MVCGESSLNFRRQSVEEKQNQKQDVALRRKDGHVKSSSEEAPVCGIHRTVTAPHWRRWRWCVPAERSSFVSDLRHPVLVPHSTLWVHAVTSAAVCQHAAVCLPSVKGGRSAGEPGDRPPQITPASAAPIPFWWMSAVTSYFNILLLLSPVFHSFTFFFLYKCLFLSIFSASIVFESALEIKLELDQCCASLVRICLILDLIHLKIHIINSGQCASFLEKSKPSSVPVL